MSDGTYCDERDPQPDEAWWAKTLADLRARWMLIDPPKSEKGKTEDLASEKLHSTEGQ